MTRKRVVIVGGGLSGLLAAAALEGLGFKTQVLEPGKLGGEFTSGGLKYIHRTRAMVSLMEELEVPHSDYKVRGGILLSGQVEPYPAALRKMPKERAEEIRGDHYMKTRKHAPDSFGEKSMNDPTSGRGSRRALRCDIEDLINALVARTKVRSTRLLAVESERNRIVVQDTHDPDELGPKYLPYDYLVLTLPLWVTRQISDFYVPESRAMLLNILTVRPEGDPYVKWDYVYTPYTPADAVHRISPVDGLYSVEVNGSWEEKSRDALRDLAWLFPDGYYLEDVKAGLKGHLLPLGQKINWPANVVGVGRFAAWDPRSTADVALELALKMGRKWSESDA